MEENKIRMTFTLDPEVGQLLKRVAGLRKYQGRDNDNPSALANAILRHGLEQENKKAVRRLHQDVAIS